MITVIYRYMCVLQFYAHNICIVYNIKEVDLKMFNFDDHLVC